MSFRFLSGPEMVVQLASRQRWEMWMSLWPHVMWVVAPVHILGSDAVIWGWGRHGVDLEERFGRECDLPES